MDQEQAEIPALIALFALPEYDWAVFCFVKAAVDELMTSRSPLLSQIKRVPVTGMTISRNTMPSGEIVENHPVQLKLGFSFKIEDAIQGKLDSLIEAIDTAAEEATKIVVPQFFEYAGRLSSAAGTATDANGQPLSRRLLIESLEKMDIGFDEEGQPEFPTLWTSEEMLRALRALPPATPEEDAEWVAFIDRKRKDFNDRRRHRQLS